MVQRLLIFFGTHRLTNILIIQAALRVQNGFTNDFEKQMIYISQRTWSIY